MEKSAMQRGMRSFPKSLGRNRPQSPGLTTPTPQLTGTTCKGVSSVALRAPSNTPLHVQFGIEPSILCCHICALFDSRSQCSSVKTPWRDGTTHIVMSPLEFMQRLAALVPRPRLHLIRFHGVLAPNA